MGMTDDTDFELRLLRSARHELDAQSVRRLSIDRAFDALVARIIRDGSSHLSLAKTMSPRHRRTPVHQHRIGAA